MRVLSFFLTFIIVVCKLGYAQLQVGDKAANFVAINQKGGEVFTINKTKQGKVMLVFSENLKSLRKNLEYLNKHYQTLIEQNTEIVLVTPASIKNIHRSYVHYPNVDKIIYDPNKQIMSMYKVNHSVIGYCIDETKQIQTILYKKS